MKKAEETSRTRVTRRFVAENRDGKEAAPWGARRQGTSDSLVERWSTIGAEILGSDREDGEVGEDQAVDPRNFQSSCIGTKEGVNAAGSNLEGRVYFFNSLDHSNLNGPSPKAQGKKAQPMDNFLAHPRPRKRQRSDDPFDLNDIIGIVQTPASVSASDPVSRSMDLNSQPLPDPVQEGATVVVTRDESVEDQDHGGGHLVSSGLD
ncbi:hypothetical protein L1987_57360 [Smallanthus sonchifolius]|uniref:Uncharacterized protein n=1 Tax=Smallanthus sonchifolius TaxID=185202 RepID=A0ACB9DCS7_9ASTR|nr:hypothetical protein L1987_57360 [Smallanthus sonchifolius]